MVFASLLSSRRRKTEHDNTDSGQKVRASEGDRALPDLQIGCFWNYHGTSIVGLGCSCAHIPWFCCNQRYYRGWNGERVHVFCTKMHDHRALIEHTDSLC